MSATLQPRVRLPWMALLLAGPPLLIVVALAAHVAGPLREVLPALLPVCGWVLLRRDRTVYFGWMMAVWFLIPLVRRLVDWSAGWVDPNPILVTPYLVSLVAPLQAAPALLRAPLRKSLPMLLPLAGLALGAVIGYFGNGPGPLVHAAFDWATPVLFAGYLLLAEDAPYRDFVHALQRYFPALLGVAALYTVVQFAVAPPWDTNWLVNLDSPSAGTPEPFGMRAFGPLNSAGIAAFAFSIGTVFLLQSNHRLRLPLAALCTAALLTTEVRAGWLVLAAGLVLSLVLTPRKAASGVLVLTLLGGIAATVGLGGGGSVAIADRLQTFSHPGEDASGRSRTEGLDAAAGYLLSHPLGAGLGVPDDIFDIEGSFSLLDSAPANIFVSLGFPAGALYCAGLLLLVLPGVRCAFTTREGAVQLLLIPALALGSIFALGSIVTTLPGLFVWSFLAAGLRLRQESAEEAEQAYTESQHATRLLSQGWAR